jgi:hypothetical protein
MEMLLLWRAIDMQGEDLAIQVLWAD